MPLIFGLGNTRCPVVVGWRERMATKVAVAGAVGAAVGSVLSVLQQQPLVRFTASSTASFVLLAACFSTLQETSRLVHCQDSPINSVLAGAGTGALLYKSHGRPGGHGAVILGSLAGAAHWATRGVDSAGGLRNFLVSVDLLDPPANSSSAHQGVAAAAGAAAGEDHGAEELPPAERPWWHAYLPIKKLTDAEWRVYKAQQDDVQRARIEAALAGGLPAMVERRHRQQDEQTGQQGPQGTAAK